MIKHILLDWGGTIGRAGARRYFVATGRGLLPEAKRALRQLHMRADLGIVSNTSVSRRAMAQGLRKAQLSRLFPVQVYSSDAGLCSKPCRPILERAWRRLKRRDPSLRKSQVLFVGNDYFQDILPAWEFGFQTALVRNGPVDLVYYLALLGGVQDLAVGSIAELPQKLF